MMNTKKSSKQTMGNSAPLLLLLIIAFGPLEAKTKCGAPKDATDRNGGLKVSSYDVGGTMTFVCNLGYEYTGTVVRTCQLNGEWSGRGGHCQKISCGDVPYDPNSDVQYTGREYQDEATMTCKAGYNYTEPLHTQRTCLSNKTWSGENGKCEMIECPDLTAHVQGSLLIMDKKYVNGTVLFRCYNPGYKYNGTNPRVCQEDGQWSGTPGFCQEILCLSAAVIEHGVISSRSNSNKAGSVVTYGCREGYILEGLDTINCRLDGQWSGSPGRCIKQRDASLWFLIAMILLSLFVLVVICMVFLIYKCVTRGKRTKGYSTVNQREVEAGMPLYNKAKETASHDEPDGHNILRSDHTVHQWHWFFIPEHSAQLGKKHSLEYNEFASKLEQDIRKQLQSVIEGTVKVLVTYIWQTTHTKVFIDLKCSENLPEELIRDKLKNICIGLKFRDDVSNAVALEILHTENVADDLVSKIELDKEYVFNRSERLRDIVPDGMGRSLIMIYGPHGIGKSSVVQSFMRRWAHGECAQHLKAIFLLNLRVLMTMKPMDLPHLLSHFSVYPICQTGITVTMAWLEVNQKSICIILDHLDDINDFLVEWEKDHEADAQQTEADPITWFFHLMKRICLPESHLIIVCRNSHGSIGSKLEIKDQNQIEVTKLSDDNLKRYIHENARCDKANQVKKFLKSKALLPSVSAVPYICKALCQMLQDPNMMGQLTTYTQITAYILMMCIDRSLKKPVSRKDLRGSSSAICSMYQKDYKALLEAKSPYPNLYERLAKEYDATESRLADPQVQSTQSDIFGELPFVNILGVAGLLLQDDVVIKEEIAALQRNSEQASESIWLVLLLYGFIFNHSNKTILEFWELIGGRSVVTMTNRQSFIATISEKVKDELHILQIVYETQSPEVARSVRKKFKKVEDDKVVTKVEFHNRKMTSMDVMGISFFITHCHVTEIKLVCVGLDSAGMQHLAQSLMTQKTIKEITLKDDLDDTCMKYLADAMALNTSVQRLCIISEVATSIGLESFSDVLRHNKALCELSITNDNVTDIALHVLAIAMKKNKTLTMLRLLSEPSPKTSVSDMGVKFLADTLSENNSLRYVVIPWTNITPKGVQYLQQAVQSNTNVELQLRLSENYDHALIEPLKEYRERVRVIPMPEEWMVKDDGGTSN